MKNEPMWRRYRRMWGPDVAADVEDEIEFHVQTRADDYVRGGMTARDARARAEKEFGDMSSAKQQMRDIDSRELRRRRRSDWFTGLNLDLKHAARRLASSPMFTFLTVITLALGIGANTAAFSVVNGVLLRPFAYADPDRLVRIFETFPLTGGAPATGSVSYLNYIDWKAQNKSFTDLALTLFGRSINLQGGDRSERLLATDVSPNLFPILGVNPLIGRAFLNGDDQPAAQKTVVLSEQFWQRRFGGDRSVLGTNIVLDGESYTIVGVMPARFHFPEGSSNLTDVWVPLRIDMSSGAFNKRGQHNFNVIGRLKRGFTLQSAQNDMSQIATIIEKTYPQEQEKRSVQITSLRESVIGRVKPTLLVLLGAAFLVLIIACGNAASLLLTRAVGRQREIAVLSAIGAGRGRIVRQFLTESMLLAALGGLVGLIVAYAATYTVTKTAARLLPRAVEIGFDARVAGFLVLTALLTGLVFGAVPALQASKADLQSALREGGRHGSAGRAANSFRNMLVIMQVALSLVLLIGAGLLLRTFAALAGTNTGMRTEQVLTMQIPLATTKYPTAQQAQDRFYSPALERVRAIPGIGSLGMINILPLARYGSNGNFTITGKTYHSISEQPFAEYRVVTPGYFQTLGIPVVRGRDIGQTDQPNSPLVVLINQTVANDYFPNEDPIGKQLNGIDSVPATIVGIVGDVRQARLEDPPRPELYFAYPQEGSGLGEMSLVIRTGVDPASVARAVERAVHEIDPGQPVYGMRTMKEVVATSITNRRFYLGLLGSFALTALLLAIAGIYGVLSYSVSQRTREFGIRLALGSDTALLRRMVVGQSVSLAMYGLAIGIPIAFASRKLLASLLYGVGAADPLTYVVVSLVLASVALVAGYIPARRATRVDPAIALRVE